MPTVSCISLNGDHRGSPSIPHTLDHGRSPSIPHRLEGNALSLPKWLFFFITLIHLLSPLDTLASPSKKTLYDFGNPSAREQYMLELINQARPKAPLAWNSILLKSAKEQSKHCLNQNTFSHQNSLGQSAQARIQKAGYPMPPEAAWKVAENLALGGNKSQPAIPALIEELHQGLLLSPQHRRNLLNEQFREIGISVLEGSFEDQEQAFNSLMITQHFGFSSQSPSPTKSGYFITGVIFEDRNQNQDYDIGEGIEHIHISASQGDYATETVSSGGFTLPMGFVQGDIVLYFSGERLPKIMEKPLSLSGQANAKVDVVLPSILPPTTSPDKAGK